MSEEGLCALILRGMEECVRQTLFHQSAFFKIEHLIRQSQCLGR